MKLFQNKKVVSSIAIVMFIALTISFVSMNPSTALAARFPGVDYLIKDNTTENPMNVLEIVSNESEASFGFYIQDQEPFGLDENGYPLEFEEVLASLTNKSDREAYVNTLLQKLNGKYGTNSSDVVPLIYEAYNEKYFLEEGDVASQWKELVFDEIKTVQINGHYNLVPTAEDGSAQYGDYLLKLATFEPVANGKGTYVENIAAFTYAGEGNNYVVEFTTEETLAKPEYGTYQLEFLEVARVGEGDYPTEGEYWIQTSETEYEEIDIEEVELQQGTILYVKTYTLVDNVLESDVIPFYVQKFEFSYKSEGNYSVIYASETDKFIPSENGTHIRVEDRYAYAPGKGDYYFEENSTEDPVDVEVPGIYYQGGFTSYNWFSRYVLNLTGNDLSDNRMNIRVQTKEASKVTVDDLADKDLVVLSSGQYTFNISEGVATRLASLIESSALPCIISSELLSNSVLYNHLQAYTKDDADNNYVNGSVYWHTGDIFNTDLFAVWQGTQLNGFEEIQEYITQENQFITLEGLTDTLSEHVSQAVAIQYILGKQAARVVPEKSKLTVLEIQPCAQYVVNEQVVRNVTGYSGLANDAINIVHMTTAEFIGKIEDLNGTYDFIYIGMATGRMNTVDGVTVYNDSSLNGLIYTHTGDYVIAEGRLAGLLDTDYVFNVRPDYTKKSDGSYQITAGTGFYPYDKDVYNVRTYVENGILRARLEEIYYKVNSPEGSYDADNDGTHERVTVSNVGVYRYSGNDITKEKMDDLIEYMNAGYPIVLAEGFFNETTRGRRTVNADKVDNSSYMYEFANTVINRKNTFRDADIVNRSATTECESFDFYMKIPKLNINTYDGGSLPVSVLPEDNGGVSKYLKADSGGRYYLEYTFKIDNEAAAKPTEARYTVSLAIDINSDGKYSRTTEYMSDLIVYEAGKPDEIIANDSLEEGILYTVVRQIPDDYESVIPWKLEVSQTSNRWVRKSIIGYSAIQKQEATAISVLHITPNSGNTWNFANDSEFQTLLDELNNVFTITITTNTVSQIDGRSDLFNYLNQYDMLIFGFKNMYGEIKNESTAKAILSYIDTGKSVLFTHDTTSFVNTQDRRLDTRKNKGWWIFGKDSTTMSANEWGYYFNTEIRNALGMDRYGITSTEKVTEDGNVTIRDELRKGQILNPGLATTDPDYDANDEVVVEAIKEAKKDVAYVAKSNRTQTYPEVQGYTYSTLNLAVNDLEFTKDNETVGNEFNEIVIESISIDTKDKEITLKAKNAYSGIYIVEYDGELSAKFELHAGQASLIPERYVDWTIPNREKSAGINVTGFGIYRLVFKMKQGDINDVDASKFKVYKKSDNSSVVTGTKTSNLNLNSSSGVYSMGTDNAFDYTTVTNVNKGQITNYPFKIADSFTVAKTHAQYYQLDLEADRDNDGESDIVVWYCISDGDNNDLSDDPTSAAFLTSDDLYSASPNDVRNNYYIYSIGNVFYSGVGHSNVSEGNSVNEKKLFINTMVAAYQSATMKPEVTALSSEDVLAAVATSIPVPVDLLTNNAGVQTSHEIKYYYSVYDSNLVSGSLASGNAKEITARYYIEDATGTKEINGVKVKDITNLVTTTSGKQAVAKDASGSYIVESGKAYTNVWNTTDLPTRLETADSFSIYIEVTSKFRHNGKDLELTGNDQILVKRVDLFDLD